MASTSGSKVFPIDDKSSVSESGQISQLCQHDEEYSSSDPQSAAPQQTHMAHSLEIDKLTTRAKHERWYGYVDRKSFIQNNFKQNNCYRFVPLPDQMVERTIDLKCHCGEILTGHRFHRRNLQVSEMVQKQDLSPYISKELEKIMSEKNWSKPPPTNISTIVEKWTKDKDIHTETTTSFGFFYFKNVKTKKRSLKYIRLSDTDSVDKTLKLMMEYWELKDPHPNLVISVVGDSDNFNLDGRMIDTFSNGLIKTARVTNAWLITSGFDIGVVKSVGKAVHDKRYSSDHEYNRATVDLRCIGIAPWGYVKDRHRLEGEDDKEKCLDIVENSNATKNDGPLPLNPDHSHFIFVDDGFRNRNKGAASFRAQLEKQISAPKSEKGLAIPLVLVVVGGETDAINAAHTSLKHGMPVVICAGTGGAADIIAFAYSHTEAKRGKQVTKEQYDLILMGKIHEAYQESCKSNISEVILVKVKECCEKAELVTIFDMNKQEDLNESILSALLKALSNRNESEKVSVMLDILGVALTWNRVDIAQYIFQQHPDIYNGDMLTFDDITTRAIREDKVEFVRLLIQQRPITDLYMQENMKEQGAITSKYMEDNMEKLCEKAFDHLNENESKYKEVIQLLESFHIKIPNWKDSVDLSKRPYKHLFVMALLNHRQEMAKLWWESGGEQVASAIAATRIYGLLSQSCTIQESHLREELTRYSKEFEDLAICFLNECHSSDPEKAVKLVNRKSPSWNYETCMQMAASANDQKFLCTESCQKSIDKQWKSTTLPTWQAVGTEERSEPWSLLSRKFGKSQWTTQATAPSAW